MNKTYFKQYRLFLLVIALLAGNSHLAHAQNDWVVRDTYEPTAPRLLYTAARSLGMLRGNRELEVWLTLRYEGSGYMHQITGTNPSDWPRIDLDRFYAEIAYPDGGLRYDLTSSDGERSVWVTAGEYSWDEQNVEPNTPPVGESQTNTIEFHNWRKSLLASTPTAAIRFAHNNIQQVQVTELEHRIYELDLPDEGIKIRLNRNRRPELVEMRVEHPVFGQATLTVEYSGYRDYEPIDPLLSDEMMSGFYFPSRIVQKLDDHTILDIEIDTCWCTNPYVIFPIPGDIISTSSSH